eukprot:CAMPEP_0184493994 /NCGR_PEP_ID=MMETSP0113_2-20130426/27520_1 /TAXON_ID=91329 /ORGANISM="Norrisiella sphaerica, Strain BC52" /LENGTH=519 /DNA_ID=CAMNT_0026879523 /DNA_START=53 /DNA_END=1609 /DNA_ORIENTATION=-
MTLFISAHVEVWRPEKYACVVCDALVEALMTGETFAQACNRLQSCDFLQSHESYPSLSHDDHFRQFANFTEAARAGFSRLACEAAGLCPKADPEAKRAREEAGTGSLDIRVTPVLGSRTYDHVRVSLIDAAPTEGNEGASKPPVTSPEGLFTYSEPFRYRWTDKRLSSGLLKVVPGEVTKVSVEGQDIEIFLPAEGAGVRGVIIADPCFAGNWIPCEFGSKLQTFHRISGFLNTLSEIPVDKGGIHFWMILGDNFYDRTGELTSQFFSALSAKTKAKLFAAAPGNHDYWVGGSPLVSVKHKDQFGNGFMQYYAMDTISGAKDPVSFLDFSQDPSQGGSATLKKNLPAASNFMAYFKIGNLAFISYSGAYDEAEVAPFLEESCAWLGNQTDVVSAFVLGHWNDGGLGCSKGMAVPSVRAKVERVPGCAAFGEKLKYFMGHTHCNEVTDSSVGFMVAGMGMEGCGNFGIPVVDSTADSPSLIYYYPIQDAKDPTQGDMYNSTMGCFEESGVGGCVKMAKTW